MASDYDPKEIEKKWQAEWEKNRLYDVSEQSSKPKYYSLMEFPYPSGDGLHTGHVRGYTAMDIIARKRRMEGFNVLYPIGWDAFGLPTENFALKTGKDPRVVTQENTDNFRKQFKSLGMSFDWSREINSTDPKYYKWTQWIFLKFLEKGLAYKAKQLINWCPKDKIGLANEEVVNGRCERCGTPVEKREKEQWMLKITAYAERLLKDLDEVDYQPRIKLQQQNWIGKSEGAEINFEIKNKKSHFIILHGNNGSAEKDFIPGLKKALEAKGYEVEAPTLPSPSNPMESEQIAHVLKNCKLDENAVVIGHSLGAVVALKSLMQFNSPVSGVVLVAPAVDPDFPGAEEKPFWKNFTWDFDYELITRLTGGKIAILSDTRETSRMSYLKSLAEKLQALLIEVQSQETHFRGAEEPAILAAVTPEVSVFTTRPDTIFGATYLVLAPEHPWIGPFLSHLENKSEVEKYVKEAKNKTDIDRSAEGKDKTGVELKGIKAINPATREEIPIWVADYVLPNYGTGAIMAVPADDKRDEEFAQKFKLPIVKDYKKAGFEDFGKKVTKYKLRDWVFSRQRYWGEPIPVVWCEKDGYVPVPESELPVVLPEVKNYQPTDTGESPLANISEWVNTTCPKCGGRAKRETDTMPNWAGSSWYFLRYADPHNDKEFAAKDALKYWQPVDWYNGGMEHTVLHLLYSRFWNKFLFDLGLVPTSEPYKKRTSHGLILAEGGVKMSKSKGNVINPDVAVKQFGADTLRLYEMFMGPFDQAIAWSEAALAGPRRFIEKVWKIGLKQILSANSSDASRGQNLRPESASVMHQTIKKVTEDIETMSFNTAISALMIWVNDLEKREVSREEYETLLKLLAPFAPHVAEELWQQLGHKNTVHLEPWPKFDEGKLHKETVMVAVQVNGKLRATLEVPAATGKEELEQKARALPEVSKWTEGQKVAKVVVVPGKVVNIVTT